LLSRAYIVKAAAFGFWDNIMSNPASSNVTADLEKKVERTAKTYSNVRTIIVALVSVIGAIFAAGVYYSELRHTLDGYVKRIEALEAQQTQVRQDIEALRVDLASEKTSIRTSVNIAFEKLVEIPNSGAPFTNTEPRNNGGGNNPTFPPGRCQIGQVVVGISPFKADDGTRSIIFQCGTLPKVKVE
jgi:hypothetical protein